MSNGLLSAIKVKNKYNVQKLLLIFYNERINYNLYNFKTTIANSLFLINFLRIMPVDNQFFANHSGLCLKRT